MVAAGNADAFVEDVVLEVNEDEDDIDLRFRFAAEAVFGKGDGLTVRSSKARNKLSLAKSITTVINSNVSDSSSSNNAVSLT